MKRDLQSLASRTFDLLVVGGGIHGLTIARDAAQRGLLVALIDRNDLAACTSSNSLKIVHGGLRYLQTMDLVRMRESIRERRTLLCTAPHLVRPLPCLMPTFGHTSRGRLAMRAALWINDLVSWDRNATGDPGRRLPAGRLLSRARYRELDPGGSHRGTTGAALWHDAQMIDPDRLALAVLQAACESGTVAANRVAATGPVVEGGQFRGVMAEDGPTGEQFLIRARLTINATGPWAAAFLPQEFQSTDKAPFPPLSLALNLVLRRPLVGQHAVACRVAGSGPRGSPARLLFLTPWRGITIAGTHHLPYEQPAAPFRLKHHQVAEFLDEINRARPSARLRLEDIALIHAGLLPSSFGAAAPGGVTLARRPFIVDHGEVNRLPGLLTVMGIKWTTSRSVAERVVDLAFRLQGFAPPPSRTAQTPLPGGDIDNMERYIQGQVAAAEREGIAGHVARRLTVRYGSRWRRLLPLAARNPRLLEPLAAGTAVLGVEILHALREEMALSLVDLVRRRTDLGTAGEPAPAALLACAHLAGKELAWDESRIQEEISAVRALYLLPES